MNKEIEKLLREGFDVNFGRYLSIANLRNHIDYKGKRVFQVDSSHPRLQFSFVYEKLTTAVDKFLGLRTAIIELTHEFKRVNKQLSELPTESKTE